MPMNPMTAPSSSWTGAVVTEFQKVDPSDR